MLVQHGPAKTWDKEKEDLKLEFERITNKYCMFEVGEHRGVSEKLQLRFAKTKKELHKIIAAL